MILKVTLPLVALAILSSLFLFSRPIDPEDAIPYADVEIADRLAQPRMTGAGFSTVTSDGATLTLTAEAATPQAGGAVIKGLSGALTMAGGGSTDITAAQAVLDRTAARLTLGPGVTLSTSTGYVIRSDAVVISTDRTRAESPDAVQVTGPAGDLTAGSFRLDRTDENAPYLLVFKNGVRLIYQPKS